MKLIDLTGQRFGRLTVVQRDGFGNAWQTMWLTTIRSVMLRT